MQRRYGDKINQWHGTLNVTLPRASLRSFCRLSMLWKREDIVKVHFKLIPIVLDGRHEQNEHRVCRYHDQDHYFFYSTGIVLINITCIFLTNIKTCLVYNTCHIDYYTNFIWNQIDNDLLIIPGSQHLSRWSPEFRRPRAELPAQ